jgi:iron complex outermembrane receptor protein
MTSLFAAPWAAAQTATAGDGADTSLQRVEVTGARKRAEQSKDVPIAIESFSGKFLENAAITTPLQLQFNVPNLTIQTYETGGLITLRGVGAGSTGLGYDPSSAVHIDGLYLGTSSQALGRLFDLSGLEVLKGPQGTLYGRNATGGVVNINTRAPSDTFSGRVELNAGSFKTYGAEAVLNVPLGEDTAMRVALVGSNGGEGTIYNINTGNMIGDDAYSAGRLRLRTKLGAVTADLLAQFIDDRATAPQAFVADPRSALPIHYNSVDVATTYQGYRRTHMLVDPTSTKKDSVLGLTLSGEINSAVSWKSITGALDQKGKVSTDVSSMGQTWLMRLDQTTKQVSQEFQLAITQDRTDWVLGAYYYRQKATENRVADVDAEFDGVVVPNFQNSDGRANATAYALFADVNHRLTDKMRVSGGLRLNREIKDAWVGGSGVIDPPAPVSNRSTFNDVSGRIGLDYALRNDTMVYGSISKGFKAGGVQPFVNQGTNTLDAFNPETVVAYEGGVKHSLPNKAGQLNLAVFYYDYRDIQARICDLANCAVRNAATAKVHGLEVQYETKVVGALGVDLTAGLLNGTYGSFVTTDAQGLPHDYSGNDLPRAPRLTYAVAATLDKQPVGGLLASGRLEYTYRGKMYFEQSNARDPGQEQSVQDGFGLVNLSISLTKDRAPWTVSLAARNLTSKDYIDFSVYQFAIPGPARSWQLRYDYRF